MEPLQFVTRVMLAAGVGAMFFFLAACQRGDDKPPQTRPLEGSPAAQNVPADQQRQHTPGPGVDTEQAAREITDAESEGDLKTEGLSAEEQPAQRAKKAEAAEAESGDDAPGNPGDDRATGGRGVPVLEEPPEMHTVITPADPTEMDEAPDPGGDEPPRPGADLGPPLVDNPDQLVSLHPGAVWFDRANRRVVLVGSVCQRRVPLELFACLKHFKEHESIVAIDTPAYVVHAGLLAAGAEPGGPVQFYPDYVSASGPEIDITVRWKNAQGEVRQARAQDWIRDAETGKAMEHPWVFAGSMFSEDEETGERYYRGDTSGDLICVSNFPTAVLDLPIQSSDSNSALLFQASTERIPPLGTPVTLVLTPRLDRRDEPAGPGEDAKPPLPPEDGESGSDQGQPEGA